MLDETVLDETVFSTHSLRTQVSKINVDLLLLHDAGPVQPHNDSTETDPKDTRLHCFLKDEPLPVYPLL